MNNLDMNSILSMLGKVDKKDLEIYMQKANEIMKSNDKDKLIDELKKNIK